MKSVAGLAPEVVSFEAWSFSGSAWWMRHKLDSLCHFSGKGVVESGKRRAVLVIALFAFPPAPALSPR